MGNIVVLGILALISVITMITLIAILSSSKGKSKIINQFRNQIDTLKDELKRQREDNLHLRNELKRINSLDNLFSSSMIKLTEKLNPIEIAKTDTNFLREYLDATEVAVFWWDEKGKRLNIVAQYGLNENWLPRLFYNLGEGKVGVAAEKRLPIGIREAEMLRIQEPFPVFNPVLCYPLTFQDKLFGVIAISRQKEFEEREKNLLGVVSKITAVALKNTSDLKLFQNLASIDPLTKIYNIGYFKDCLHEALNKAQKACHQLSVGIIDLDKFKQYNDTYGHQAGDQLLIKLAQLFARYFSKPALLARYGGDEFIVMCPDVQKQNVFDIMNILLQELKRNDLANIQKGEKVTFSAGISCYLGDGDNATELIKRADEELYKAKGAGRSQVQIYGQKLDG